ncbi:hypothetical protein VRRI112168_17750 [Vreelandella rituensis]|uniref:Uncharacterized protein n=1 Tax=Vreelandella rituensis TaxID=2282306 RepID=A0A368TNV0_9GAMM|nr:hypothetical protein [Halomonas rituensis]RCV85986.1 hypothetical protein DU506_19450 [Halomonas rituensis]
MVRRNLVVVLLTPASEPSHAHSDSSARPSDADYSGAHGSDGVPSTVVVLIEGGKRVWLHSALQRHFDLTGTARRMW